MGPSLGKLQTSASDKVSYHSRNKHFAGLRLGHDSGCGVHRYAANVLTSDFNLTGMETRADR